MDEREAERWLYEEGEWLSPSEVAHLIGSDGAAATIALWAGTEDGARPIVRARASLVEFRRNDGTLIKRWANRLPMAFWEGDEIRSDIAAAIFDRGGGALGCLARAVGVQLNADDVRRQVGGGVAKAKAPPGKRGRPVKYDWPALYAFALGRLEYHGGFLGIEWKQADLEGDIQEWALKEWGLAPGVATVRSRIKDDILPAFQRRKEGQ